MQVLNGGKRTKIIKWKGCQILVWDQENLYKKLQMKLNICQEGKTSKITGVAPAWLVSALAHTVHPCPVSVYTPQIGKYGYSCLAIRRSKSRRGGCIQKQQK